ATDVASRRLDIEGLPQVINFDVPHYPEDYIHRIGRTGRAGLTGEAISLVAPEDLEYLAAIEKLIKKRIERVPIPGFQPNAGTVAALMGGEPSRPPRRDANRSAVDPIFSTPYEPGSSPPAPAPGQKSEHTPSKRQQTPSATRPAAS